MTAQTQPARLRRILWQRCGVAAVLTLLLAGALFVYQLPVNGSSSWLPPCMLQESTGLHCPGCGATRAARAVVHGEVAQAAAYNFLFVLALPFVFWWGLRASFSLCRARESSFPLISPWVAWLMLVILVTFALLRNLPLWPFHLLAPHALP